MGGKRAAYVRFIIESHHGRSRLGIVRGQTGQIVKRSNDRRAQWDEDLAEMAQAWADQCALVEYTSGGQQPKRLFHDARAKRSVGAELPGFLAFGSDLFT